MQAYPPTRLQLPSLCHAPHYSPPHPCLVVACKIIYCSANDAHRVGFVVFHNLRNQPESSYALSLPCTHTPLHFSLCHSLRRHARFRAFACVVHIWQHVACRLPQLTNGCLSGENMFLRNFIRLHLVVALLSPFSLSLDAPSCGQCYCLMSGCWPFLLRRYLSLRPWPLMALLR